MSNKPQTTMADVGAKLASDRSATARCVLKVSPATLNKILQSKLEKGDALTAAQLAGVMAAKKTSSLIPLCHPLPLDNVQVTFAPCTDGNGIEITATVKTHAKTGVEMEALSAAAVAALTIYDMCKSIERGASVQNLRLTAKSGGASGDYRNE